MAEARSDTGTAGGVCPISRDSGDQVMRIALLNSETGMRGGEYQTLALAEGLVARGCGVALISRKGSMLSKLRPEGVCTLGLPFERIPLVTPLAIRRFVSRWKPDVVHVQTSKAHTHARIASLTGAGFPPLVVSRRVDFRISSGLGGLIKYRHGVALYIAISKAVRDRLLEAGIGPESIEVVPSGVDTAKFSMRGGDERLAEEWGMRRDDFIVGTVAPLEKEKGYPVLIDAAEKVLSDFPLVKFIFVGEGSMEKGLRSELESRNLKGRVKLVKAGRPIEEILPNFDLFVLASESEGLSTALISALAAGVPAVASDTGGIPDVLGGGAGVLASPGDSEALADAIKGLIADQEKRNILSKSGMEIARRFDISGTVDKTYDIYRRIVDSRSSKGDS